MSDAANDDFRLEFHGSAVVITPADNVEDMRWDLIEQAADIVMEPLGEMSVPLVVFDLSRFGIVKDEFGSAMITNVGTFGLSQALAPLVPFSRTPLVLLVGEVTERPVAEGGRVVVRPMMNLGVTFDHRFMDGFHGGAMLQLFRAYLESAQEGERIQQFFARHGEEDLARMAGLAEIAGRPAGAVEAEAAAS